MAPKWSIPRHNPEPWPTNSRVCLTTQVERATGPFDGVLEGPVLVYDLNLGGCFVNSPQKSVEGTTWYRESSFLKTVRLP